MGAVFHVNVGESMSVAEGRSTSVRQVVSTSENVALFDSLLNTHRFQILLQELTGLTAEDYIAAGRDFLIGLMNRIRELGGIPGADPVVPPEPIRPA